MNSCAYEYTHHSYSLSPLAIVLESFFPGQNETVLCEMSAMELKDKSRNRVQIAVARIPRRGRLSHPTWNNSSLDITCLTEAEEVTGQPQTRSKVVFGSVSQRVLPSPVTSLSFS